MANFGEAMAECPALEEVSEVVGEPHIGGGVWWAVLLVGRPARGPLITVASAGRPMAWAWWGSVEGGVVHRIHIFVHYE